MFGCEMLRKQKDPDHALSNHLFQNEMQILFGVCPM